MLRNAKAAFYTVFTLRLCCIEWWNFEDSRNEGDGEGEGEVAVFSAKRLDRRNRADLIESTTPCHDAQVLGSYWGSSPLQLTVLNSKLADCTTAPQHRVSLSPIFPDEEYEKVIDMFCFSSTAFSVQALQCCYEVSS